MQCAQGNAQVGLAGAERENKVVDTFNLLRMHFIDTCCVSKALVHAVLQLYNGPEQGGSTRDLTHHMACSRVMRRALSLKAARSVVN